MSQITLLSYLHRSTLHCTRCSMKDPAKSWNVMKNIVGPDSFLSLAHTKTTTCHNLHASSIRVIMHSKPAIVDTFSNICYLCKDLFWMLTFLQEIHPQLWFSLWWNKLNLITKELVNWKSLNSEMPHYKYFIYSSP